MIKRERAQLILSLLLMGCQAEHKVHPTPRSSSLENNPISTTEASAASNPNQKSTAPLIPLQEIDTGNTPPKDIGLSIVGADTVLLSYGTEGGTKLHSAKRFTFNVNQIPLHFRYSTPSFLSDTAGSGQAIFWQTEFSRPTYSLDLENHNRIAKLAIFKLDQFQASQEPQIVQLPKAGYNFSTFSQLLDTSGSGTISGAIAPESNTNAKLKEFKPAYFSVKQHQLDPELVVLDATIRSYTLPSVWFNTQQGFLMYSPSESRWVLRSIQGRQIDGQDADLGVQKDRPRVHIDHQGNGYILTIDPSRKVTLHTISGFQRVAVQPLEIEIPQEYSYHTAFFDEQGIILAYHSPMPVDENSTQQMKLYSYQKGKSIQKKDFSFPLPNRLSYSTAMSVNNHGDGMIAIGTAATAAISGQLATMPELGGKIHLIRLHNFMPIISQTRY